MLDFKITERIKENSETFEQHMKIYEFASKFVKNKKVLDVACGIGYGTDFLLKSGAKDVVGIDYFKEAIEYAKGRHSGKFFVMDATNIKFKANSFDAVVSVETLEHIRNWKKFVTEIKRVVKPNGIVIISTPNYKFEIVKNIYHVSNFNKDMLVKLFKEEFHNFKLYGQSKWFMAFPGRGIVERLIGYKRNYDIYKLKEDNDPQNLIGVGHVIK